MSFLLPSCEEIPPESLPASDTISSPKCDMPASEPFISKETVERTSNCEFWLKIYNFSGYDISQSVDWGCPSLFPHYLLTAVKTRHSPDWVSRTNDLLCHSRPKPDVIRCSGDCSLDVENIFLGKRY